MLKMLVNGIKNTASDGETLFGLLDARAHAKGSARFFAPTTPQMPIPAARRPSFPPKEESAAAAATYAHAILDNYVLVLRYFGLQPSTATPVNPNTYGESGLLHIMLNWQSLRAGVIKTLVREYGGEPTPFPPLPHPGPASEARLWAEVAAWLKKIAADTDSFLNAQGLSPNPLPSPPTQPPPLLDSLVSLELDFHQATLDAMQIVGVVPYHLYRAGH